MPQHLVRSPPNSSSIYVGKERIAKALALLGASYTYFPRNKCTDINFDVVYLENDALLMLTVHGKIVSPNYASAAEDAEGDHVLPCGHSFALRKSRAVVTSDVEAEWKGGWLIVSHVLNVFGGSSGKP